MSIATADSALGPPAEWRRWLLCGALVLMAHLLPAAIVIWWLGPIEPAAMPLPAAVMIDMAPLPAAPETPPTETPPGPQQTLATAPPPEPEPVPIPVPEAPAAVQPSVVLPPRPKPHPVVAVRPQTPHVMAPPDRQSAPATTAPPAAEAPPAPVPAAPAAGASVASPSTGARTWQALLLGRLEQFKRYPAEAQVRRQQGVASLRFTMDRAGNVLSFSLEKGSGFGALDREALALIQRAQPLPKPPDEVAGATIELVVPVEFFLRPKG